MKLAVIFILTVVFCLAQTSRDLERRAIAAAKQTDVNRLDVKLPHMRFDVWLQQQVGRVRIEWESNDCGEQDGFTQRADIPVCGQASATLADGRVLTVMIGVGTLRKGVQGAPGVWFLSVNEKSSTHLSDLPGFLAAPK